jgi:hypothetical protein
MGCCGQNRAKLISTESSRPSFQPGDLRLKVAAAPMPAPTQSLPTAMSSVPSGPRTSTGFARSVLVRYLARSPVLVHGPVSGRAYQFSATSPVQPVDARDVPALLNTQCFQPG